MLTHRALVSAIAACNAYLESFNESVNQEDCYFSFLPLAHVFDRWGGRGYVFGLSLRAVSTSQWHGGWVGRGGRAGEGSCAGARGGG